MVNVVHVEDNFYHKSSNFIKPLLDISMKNLIYLLHFTHLGVHGGGGGTAGKLALFQ